MDSPLNLTIGAASRDAFDHQLALATAQLRRAVSALLEPRPRDGVQVASIASRVDELVDRLHRVRALEQQLALLDPGGTAAIDGPGGRWE